jgi:hypothetical protein
MASCLLAYHGGGMAETEEEQARVMAAWSTWYEDLGASIVDGGNPVGRAETVSSDGSVTDGGGPNPVTGYTIVQADSMERAVELAKGCPVLESGGSVEVGEIVQVA